MIVVYLFSHVNPTSNKYYSYSARLNGLEIIKHSYDPEHDIARYLVSNTWLWGKERRERLVEVRDGRTGKPRTRFDAKAAAMWCIEERNKEGLVRRKWRPVSTRLPKLAA
jgi:hypothetical protein